MSRVRQLPDGVTAALPIGFAHRGARSECPENTLEAFSRALQLGATALESDAWLSAEGIVVLDHDGVIGPPWAHRAISVCPRSALPGHIPSLSDLYETCGIDFELSLDVKDPAGVGPIVEAARAAGAAERLWLCHHDWRPMAAWRRMAPEAHLVESTNLAWMKEGLAGRLCALAGAGIDALNMHRSQWEREAVKEARAVGVLAFAWDAQSEADIEHLLGIGVDGVYSDHVDRLVAAIDRPRPPS